MARATGIHISGSSVRVADVEGSEKKLRIKGFGHAPILAGPDDERVAAMTKAIKEAFKHAKASKEHVILGIPVRDCIIREITVPFTDVEQIKKVIKFEAEPHLHSSSIDEVVISFRKVGEIGNRSVVLVVAARKERLRIILEALERCGIDPLAIDIDAAGLFATTHLLEAFENKNTYVMCEVGATTTLITLVKDKSLRIVRSVRLGYESISSRVSKDLDINPAEARTRTHSILQQQKQLTDDLLIRPADLAETGVETAKTADELQRDMVYQRRGDLIARLEQEIVRTIDTVKISEPLDCVYVTGAGSVIPRLHEDLAARLRVPVHQIDALAEMDHKIPSEEIETARATSPISIGVAAKHLGVDPLGLDFRQEEFVFAKRFDRLKVPILCSVSLLVAVNVCWWFYEEQVRKSTAGQIDHIASRANTLFASIVDTKKLSPEEQKYLQLDDKGSAKLVDTAKSREGADKIVYIGKTIRDLHGSMRKLYQLDQIGGARPTGGEGASKLKFVSALRRWDQVWKALLDSKIRDLSVNSLKVVPSQVELTLTIPESADGPDGAMDPQRQLEHIRSFMKALPPEEGFLDMQWTGQTPNKDKRGWDIGKVTFTFEKEDGGR
jgi:type IV pilus assembly protein PilM